MHPVAIRRPAVEARPLTPLGSSHASYRPAFLAVTPRGAPRRRWRPMSVLSATLSAHQNRTSGANCGACQACSAVDAMDGRIESI